MENLYKELIKGILIKNKLDLFLNEEYSEIVYNEHSFEVSTSHTKEEESLKEFGIHIKDKIESVLIHESIVNILKEISSILNVEEKESIEFNSIDSIINDNLVDSVIIVNGKIAAVIQDRIDFISADNNTINNNCFFYKIGTYKNIPIIINPYMNWNDDRLIICNKKFEIYDIILDNIEDEDTIIFKLFVKIGIKSSPNEVYRILNTSNLI